METERESNRTLYGSEVKGKVRKEIIANAVHSLTKGRSTSACIKRDYPGDLLKQLQAKGTLSPERIQRLEKSLERWKKIHDSDIQEKEAHQLKVCFLAGDDPTKDLDVFLGHNVLDNNIWMVEKNHSVYLRAKEALKKSGGYRSVKFQNVDIMDFFKSNHNRFDIIYIDSCSSLPAKYTLKVIASIFQLNKLESPGALITNFSFPPKELAESVEQKQITFVANEYLQYKLETTLHQKTDEQIYSDFITHQVIDLASLLVPASHILLPTNWTAILIQKIKTFFEEVRKHLANSDDDDDVDSDAMKAIVNNFYLTKICRAMKKEKEKEIKANPLCTAWLRDVFPRSKGPSEAPDICELLQTALLFSSFIFFSKFANSETLEFLQPASRDEDKELMAWIVLGGLAEPSYPVLDKLLRLKYTQSEETCKRQMFCDVFTFDRCRYLFDLAPTVFDAGQFCGDDDDNFLMSKMLLDGMRKRLKYFCKTGIWQIDIRRQFGLSETDGNDEELYRCLPERKIVE